MAISRASFVQETTSTTGTGTYSLAGATTGRQAFIDGNVTGATVRYSVTNSTDWEVCEGVLTAGTPDTLTRGTVLESSNAGAAVNWTAGNKTISQVFTPDEADSFAGKKNVIINGNFDIWQRGISQTSSGYGSDDRWENSNTGTTKINSRQTFSLGQTDVPGNPKFYSRTAVTSTAGAGNNCVKTQKIEGVQTFAGQTVTLSFYAKADAAKNIAIEFLQNFGAGGTPSAAVNGIDSQLVALTTAWQKFEIPVTIPSISGKTLGTAGNDALQLNIWFDAGSDFNARTASLGQQSGTFDIAQVQLEKGSVATDFEKRSIGEELALCQRYFLALITSGTSIIGTGWALSGTDLRTLIPTPVSMRTAPHTVSIGTIGNLKIIGHGLFSSVTAISTYSYGYNGITLLVTIASSLTSNNIYDLANTVEPLYMSAEL